MDVLDILRKQAGEDGAIPAEAVEKAAQAVNSEIGREFVDKERYKKKLNEIETLKEEKQTAEDAATTASRWETEYNKIKSEFDTFKADVSAREARAAKEKAVRGYLAEKKIDQKAMDAALLAASAASDSFGKLELTRDGKIKDTAILDALVSGTGALASFVTTETVVGAESPPSATVKTTPTFRTLAEAMQYQNEHPETPVNLDQFFQPPPVVPAANGYTNAGGTAVPYAGFPVTPTP